jgi:hypothetical protein
MPKTANQISLLIENQLASFITDEYELFTKFVQKYYEQQELRGQPLDIITNLETYRNIDFYEKDILNKFTKLTQFLQDTDTVINVETTSSFPDSGYLKIDDEICFYKSKTETQFLEVSRGVSGNTTLGDLYTKSIFVTTQSDDHVNGSSVYNISNLFLFALVKSFESQYLPDFPISYLNQEVDQRTLIKNIADFYQSKGTSNSVKFLFKCLIQSDPEPVVYYPRDNTLKASESTWRRNYSIKANIFSANPDDLIGKQIIQDLEGNYASATVDNVLFNGTYDGIDLYELILAEETVNGSFLTSSKTFLTSAVSANSSVVDVFSTLGWGESGKFRIENETFTFEKKNVNQFYIKTRSGSASYSANTFVYDSANVFIEDNPILILGVLYTAVPKIKVPYLSAGEQIEVSSPGFVTIDQKIFDSQNNLRWKLSTSKVAGLPDVNADVSGVFQDETDYYIASSGFPSHFFNLDVPVRDQRQLRIIPKNSEPTTEIYKTNQGDVGIFVNGIVAMGAKDEEQIFSGPIQKISVFDRGSGYAKPPFVLINGVPNLARAKMAGQVVESIIVDVPGNYNSTPNVEIVSGRNGIVAPVITNGEITSLVVTNPGQFYSSPPIIRITDLAGKGRFADYTSIVSPAGQITGFIQRRTGSGYTAENIRIDVIPVGSGARANASVKSWTKNRYYKYQSKLDSNNGYYIPNKDQSLDYGYAYYASPNYLRTNDTGVGHSPILGFAYDGNPIYGPYGYSNPLNSSSQITRMTSSYSKNISRQNGPSVSQYPLGTFFEDYTYIHKLGSLDQNNGRFCVTPDFPNGTYAYFITVDSSNDPVFPYIIGDNYYSIPRDSNYNQNISQSDIPKNVIRLRTADIEKNGDLTKLLIDEVERGTVTSGISVSSQPNFSVGCKLEIDNESTGGYDASAEVSSVKGKTVLSIESQSTKCLLIDLSTTAYLFDGDIITQNVTGATGEIVGDVFSGTKFALRNVSGDFSNGDTLSSSTSVVNLILDKNSSYTVGAVLQLTDGKVSIIAQGEVLESTVGKNTVKVKVNSGQFVPTDGYYIKSSNLFDTPGSELLDVNSLSSNLRIFEITDNVAILKTADAHGVGIGDKITVDINPNDAQTTTNYYVRSRIFQKIKFESPGASTTINDSGIGRLSLLNSGENYTPGTYQNIALVGGSGSGAKANITVSFQGKVTQFTIVDKGENYSKYDILTVGNSALLKTNSSTPSLKLSVDHVGLALQENKIKVSSGIGFTDDDFIKIGNEIVKIVNRTGDTFTVLRGQKSTIAIDHFDGASVELFDPGFDLPKGLPLGQSVQDPKIEQYNPITQEAEVVFEYGQTLDTINAVSLSTVFFDVSADTRLVRVVQIEDPIEVFIFSKDNTNFIRNPEIEIKEFYKYRFNVSHSSMNGRSFDISPSISYNIETPEKIDLGSIVDLKIGFGSRVSTNLYSNKIQSRYSKYFYYDRNRITSSESGYFKVISDPLQGEKDSLYVTDTSIVYDTKVFAPHDGSGSISYTSKSRFSIGEIDTIEVTNIGSEYKKIPIVIGALPTESYRASAIVDISNGSISGVRVISGGSNYSNPRAVVDGNAVLDVVVDNGIITGVLIKHPGSGYNSIPEVRIVETDVKIYLESEDIGLPRNIRIISNGGSYHTDSTLRSSLRSNYVFTVSNFSSNGFALGESVVQITDGVETARAKVSSWRNGSNILIVKDVTGLFREDKEIIGLARRTTANLDRIRYAEFEPTIKTYFDNIGSFEDDQGIASSSNQKITDTYYYQDYSYVVKSRTPINVWRDLIKQTTHPAGFQLFGEVLIESDADISMSNNSKTVATSVIQLWDPLKNKISVVSTRKNIITSIIKTEQLKVEKGSGSIALDTFSTTEIRAKRVYLNAAFDGAFTDKGNLEGTQSFVLIDDDGAVVSPYNEQALTITLDGILQEPGSAYQVNGSIITFASPPLGPSTEDGQEVPGVIFYGRLFEFKRADLNERYLKKIRNIYQRSGTWIDAANQLAMNKAFIQSETLGYIREKYPTLSWGTLSTKCYRDIGLVIEALEHDLRFGGNLKTIDAIESYFVGGTLSYIDGEIQASIDAYSYATRLCKIAMRNWDVVERQASWTSGTDIIEITNTDNVAIGMKISAGRAFSDTTVIQEIIDSRTLRLSENSLPGNNIPNENAQVTFIWSGLNTGTFYDAATLIERNKENIQREASHRIYDEYPKFTYPGVPEEAFRFKDGRRLIYENLNNIVLAVISELGSTFGPQYATDSCARDLKIILSGIAEDLGRGSNSNTIFNTKEYFLNHDALEGEVTESVYAFEYARELCIEAINNRGSYQDPNIILVPDCTNVNSAITVLFDILIDAISSNTQPNIPINTGIVSWTRSEDFCFRDTGILVDAVVYSLRYGGNQKIVEFANAYFNNYKINHIGNELLETIYAYNVARDLMILAMRNQISGSTIVFPYTNLDIRIDTQSPYCVEVESAIANYAQIVEDILKGGPDRLDIVPENESSTGNWTSLRVYVNKNILPDQNLLNGVFRECEEVASSLDSLNEVIRNILITGPGAVEKTNPDYVDNENKEFDLYYLDGSPVITEENENLFIAISGILQHEQAYFIDKSQTPNKVVFSGAPIWGQEENVKTVQEPLAVENIALHGVGNYIRCELDTSGILDGSSGPFIILNTSTKEVRNIDDSNYALVFIDGILQREGDSYTINGPAINFSRDIYKENNVEIILLYGRDIEQSITLHDFEPTTYFNRLTLTISDTSPNDYTDLFTWFNTNYDNETFAYQKDGSNKNLIGKIKRVYKVNNNTVELVLSGNNPIFNGSEPIYGSTDYINFSDETIFGGTSATLVYALDEFGNRRMQRDSSAWLFDSIKSDESFYVQRNLLARLNAGDSVKIDGEKSYREIKKLPQYVNPKDYNAGADISSKFYGSIITTNYNGSTKGVGLSATCEINAEGEVINIEWNRKDLNLYYQQNILQKTTAYGYETPPVLHFIPVNQSGGGASAEVIVSKEQIVDIVITNKGSGYTEAPKIVVARRYNLIKGNNRKIDSLVNIRFANKIQKQSPVSANIVFEFSRGIESITAFAAAITIPENKPTIYTTLNKVVNLENLVISKEIIKFGPTSTGSVSMFGPNENSPKIYRTFLLDRTVESQPLLSTKVERSFAIETGFIDLTNPFSYRRNYSSGIAGPAAPQWRPFTDCGNILSTSGIPVSGVTIEELERYGFTIEQLNNAVVSGGIFVDGDKFNLATSSINNYLVRLQTSPLPDRGDFTPTLLDSSYVSSSGYGDPTPDGYYVVLNNVIYLYIANSSGLPIINTFRQNMTGTDIWIDWGEGSFIGGRYSNNNLTGFANSPYENRITAGQFDLFNDGSQAGVVLIPTTPVPNGIGRFNRIGNYDVTFSPTNVIVYCDTARFPTSGTILINKEQITYTSKLSDRLLGCTRGANGTPIGTHVVGDYIRLLQ